MRWQGHWLAELAAASGSRWRRQDRTVRLGRLEERRRLTAGRRGGPAPYFGLPRSPMVHSVSSCPALACPFCSRFELLGFGFPLGGSVPDWVPVVVSA